MMQLPPEEQRDENNRQFITRAQYLALPADQRRAIDGGTHQSYWGMNAPTAAAIGTQIIKERAKKMVEVEKDRAAKYLEKHGVKKAAAPAPAPTPPPARATPAPAPAPRPRQVSPPSTNPSAASAPKTAGNEVAPEFRKRFLELQFWFRCDADGRQPVTLSINLLLLRTAGKLNPAVSFLPSGNPVLRCWCRTKI
jgi:hypothetical protein